jgi:hypothetical protein
VHQVGFITRSVSRFFTMNPRLGALDFDAESPKQ